MTEKHELSTLGESVSESDSGKNGEQHSAELMTGSHTPVTGINDCPGLLQNGYLNGSVERRGPHGKGPVMIVSADTNDQFRLYTLASAEAESVLKECNTDSLIQAVRSVVTDARRTHSTTHLSANDFMSPDSRMQNTPLHAKLSQRELQIVTMLGAGKSVGAIAVELGLSVKTVSTYRTRALEKMNLKTNADLIRYVIEKSLTPSRQAIARLISS